MKTTKNIGLALSVLFIVAFSISSCMPRRVVVVEHRPKPAKVIVVKRPARVVVVRPPARPHPHRVVIHRRR